MTSLTVELQDETYRRLRELAEARGVTLDSLIETLGSGAISAHPAESRFRAAARKASAVQAHEILDRLDQAEQQTS